MNFSHPWMLHFLWVVPLMLLLFVVSNRRRSQAMKRFADPHLLSLLIPGTATGRHILRPACLLTGLGLMVLAWAGPRWGSHYEEVRQKGVDIVIALDISQSMLVADVEPNRLVRAKREILDLIRVIQGDRLGLVAFAGAAFTQCPLTLDYGALLMFLNALTPDMAPAPGTDLGAAIDAGMGVFDPATETDKVLLLITDGEDNEHRGLEAARKAARKGVKIFVFGMGDPSGGPIPAADGTGGFKKDSEGQMILSRLDEEGLKAIARVTGGSYVRSMAGDLDLDLLYFDGIKQKTKASDLKSGKIKVHEERFYLFVMAAFFLLLVEALIPYRGKGARGTRNAERGGRNGEKGTRSAERGTRNGEKGARNRATAKILLTFWVAGCGMVLIAPSAQAEDPDELYREGRFAEARKLYEQSELDQPKDLRHRYNRGCADYQAGDYQSAMAAFSSVLRRAEDRDLRFRAAYNLGNAALQLGDAAAAAAHYREALRIRPGQEDARYNLELALRRIEEQKQKGEKKKEPDTKGGDPGEQKEEGKGDAGEDPQSDNASRDEGSGQESADQKASGSPQDQAGREGDDAAGTGRDRYQTPDQDPKDLPGELRPRETMPGWPEPEKTAPPSRAYPMDQKRAEALLDNVTEDPSRFLRRKQPEAMRRGVPSGKDW